ncbi:MAG TPA: UDP-N-acetylmuramoyl-tripeptide--D-alanyl-D-alanine ligase [Chitinophagaceae bacterium]|nr:UDP-N-acetylmuramoyl-tripeptide--D-alanyl-D-alanine ligase [Chitinophagaceae bacterium]
MTIQELYQLFLKYPAVQTDTRKLKDGDFFFALQGPNFNANAFAKQALEKGAAYAVIDDPGYYIDERTIVVANVLQTLQQLANEHRNHFQIPILAITGSNGKTTTKELIHAVLSTGYKTYTTEGNLNNHIGVPLTLLKIKSDAQLAIIEMGANHVKEIESYCVIVEPTHGLITNCGKAHLEGFGSEAGVRQGKGELFDYLRAHGGTAFLMHDYDYLRQMSAGINSRVTYGTADADTIGTVTQNDPFLEVTFSKPYAGTIATKLVGAYNLPNVLAAVSVGHYFNIPFNQIKEALENYLPSNSRSQLVQRGSVSVIVDAYNANPNSMKAAVENFDRAAGHAKFLVLGAMAELGADSVAEHKALVAEIEKGTWKGVVLVGGDFEKIRHPFVQRATADEAGTWLQQQDLAGASVLLKGSRSMGMEAVLRYINEP